MKNRGPLKAAALLVIFGAAGQVQTTDHQNGLELFGGSTISTPAREFGVSFLPDEETVYFNRSLESGAWHIWVSKNADGGFQPAETIWFSDPRYMDLDPFVSRSGDRLYFSSDRPLPDSGTEEPTAETNTWFSPRVGDKWGAPQYAGAVVNNDASDTFVSESKDGQLLFARFGEGRGRERPAYLMIADRYQSDFAKPELIETQPSGLRLTNPAISPDGNMIVAAGSKGGSPKLYFSVRSADGRWREFAALPAPVNVPDTVQFAPYISNDGRWLYFSSSRSDGAGAGGDDIYRIPLDSLIKE